MASEGVHVDPGEIEEALSASGPLAGRLPRFAVREGQLELAQTAGRIIDEGGIGVLEAGTGIGKTFAYLVPILLSGAKAIISTSTKALQEQIVGEDLPTLVDALGKVSDVRLLKGRANYICRLRLDQAMRDRTLDGLEGEDGRGIDEELAAIAEYAASGGDGDRSGVRGVSSGSRVWPLATSTERNCTRRECPHYKGCFVYEARRKALGADVVVVNHALLLADANLKRESEEQARLLPAADVLVVDEAHVLPGEMQKQFGVQLSTRELSIAARDAEREGVKLGDPGLGEAAGALKRSLGEMRKVAEKCVRQPKSAAAALEDPELAGILEGAEGELRALCGMLEGLSLEEGDEDQAGLLSLKGELASSEQTLRAWRDPPEDMIAWCETVGKGVLHLRLTPLDSGEMFRNDLVRQRSCMLLSATMSVAGDLGSFKSQVGILEEEGAVDLMVDSPFDYEANSLLLLPDDIPDPRSHEDAFRERTAEIALELVRANSGRAFLLFTSWYGLRHAHKRLEERLDDGYELLVQGSEPPERLLRRFRRAERGQVLLGTRTFWQGVDVAGDRLSLVLIDRIPFPSPNDPLLQAQEDIVADSFAQLWLLPAALLLKQAAGRLIRSETDKGVLVICDPRMRTKGYGAKLRSTLPSMSQAGDLGEASRFLKENGND